MNGPQNWQHARNSIRNHKLTTRKRNRQISFLKSERDTLKQKAEALVEACELVDEVWTRSNSHPDINFLGDDEHGAWVKVKQALEAWRGGK